MATKGYSFFLGNIQLPIPPEKMEMVINNQNTTINLINDQEVNILRKPGLTEITFEALIPQTKYPFASYPNGFKSASYFLEQFEKWAGYPFRPEYIVDQGYHNSTFRVPSKEFRDFIEFQQREVSKLAKELVDIVHSYGKEAMMFLGDHWIGTEPFGNIFKTLDLTQLSALWETALRFA